MYVPWNNFMLPIFYTCSSVKEQHTRNDLEKKLDMKPVTRAWLREQRLVIDLLD